MIYNAYQDTTDGIAGFSIVSSGHIFSHQGRQINRPNGRCDFLLFYVAKGSEHMLLNKEVRMEPGSFVIFRPNEKQIHIQKDSGVSEFYYIHWIAHEDFDLFGFESSKVYSVEPSTGINDLFEAVIEELQTKRPVYEKICVSKFFNILSLLSRKSQKETTSLGQYVDKISFVVQKMNKEYEKNLSLDEYSSLANMSKFHFLRIFKDITGSTPIEYRKKIRIQHAKELLEDTDEAISEIGRRVGYDSSIYFCDAFKKEVGSSPSRYRQEKKKQQKPR